MIDYTALLWTPYLFSQTAEGNRNHLLIKVAEKEKGISQQKRQPYALDNITHTHIHHMLTSTMS